MPAKPRQSLKLTLIWYGLGRKVRISYSRSESGLSNLYMAETANSHVMIKNNEYKRLLGKKKFSFFSIKILALNNFILLFFYFVTMNFFKYNPAVSDVIPGNSSTGKI